VCAYRRQQASNAGDRRHRTGDATDCGFFALYPVCQNAFCMRCKFEGAFLCTAHATAQASASLLKLADGKSSVPADRRQLFAPPESVSCSGALDKTVARCACPGTPRLDGADKVELICCRCLYSFRKEKRCRWTRGRTHIWAVQRSRQ
jgi:hypothetical protein